MPLQSRFLGKSIKTEYGFLDGVTVPRNPSVRPDGISFTDFVFEIPKKQKVNTRGSSIDFYIPGWKDLTPDDCMKLINSKRMVDKAFKRALKRAKRLRSTGTAWASKMTEYFTQEVTKLEHSLMTAYTNSLTVIESNDSERIVTTTEEIANEFKDILYQNLDSARPNSLSDSILKGTLDVYPSPIEPQQLKTKIRLSVTVRMEAYGYIRDLGRPSNSKRPPLHQIEDWITRYNIKPYNSGMSTKKLAYLIARKIGKDGYPGNSFFMNSLEELVTGNKPEYFFRHSINNSIEKNLDKAVSATGRKYSNYRKTLGNMVIQVS